MAEAPTREGQNVIIKNLSSIFMTLMGLALAALFAWGQNVSNENNKTNVNMQALQDRVDKLEAKQDGQIKGVRNDITDIRADVEKITLDAEKVHDDLKIRVVHLEDWNAFKPK